MKKFTLTLTALLLIGALSNCTKEKTEAIKTDMSTATAPVVAPQIEKLDTKTTKPATPIQSDLPQVQTLKCTTNGKVIKYETTRSASKFEDLLKDNTYVVVKLGATWCPPCKAMIKPLEDSAKEFSGKVTFIEIDIDKNPEIQSRYADNARSIPTTMFFHNGQKKHQHTGGLSKTEISKKVKEFLKI